ncbi:MAG: hypothetical protein IPH20_27345 [Bacteroidales bacterium]|nr:hypothetical protein [Bacteroidales bacterium]
MEKVETLAGLKATIEALEARQEEQSMQLRYQADLSYESLKPVNLIKSVFSNSSAPSSRSGNLLSNSVGLSAGYIAKIVIEGAMKRPLSRLVGNAVMFGIQTIIAKNPNTIRNIGTGLFSLLRRSRKETQTELNLNN